MFFHNEIQYEKDDFLKLNKLKIRIRIGMFIKRKYQKVQILKI